MLRSIMNIHNTEILINICKVTSPISGTNMIHVIITLIITTGSRRTTSSAIHIPEFQKYLPNPNYSPTVRLVLDAIIKNEEQLSQALIVPDNLHLAISVIFGRKYFYFQDKFYSLNCVTPQDDQIEYNGETYRIR